MRHGKVGLIFEYVVSEDLSEEETFKWILTRRNKTKLLTCSSEQDRITGTRFNILLQTPKQISVMNETVVFKTWNIRQWKPVISGRWETKEVNSITVPVYCPERVSRLQQREEEETQEETSSLCWEDGDEKPGKPKQLQRIEDPRDLQFPPWTKYQSIHTYAVAIQGHVKNHLKGLKEMVPNTQTVEIVSIFYHQAD